MSDDEHKIKIRVKKPEEVQKLKAKHPAAPQKEKTSPKPQPIPAVSPVLIEEKTEIQSVTKSVLKSIAVSAKKHENKFPTFAKYFARTKAAAVNIKLPAFSKKKKDEEKITPGVITKDKKKKARKPLFFRGFSIKELVHFAKRLAFLIRSGVPILESLQILRKQTRSKLRGKMLDTVIADVSNGRPLSMGLGRFRESFGDFAVSVVRVGEMSGTLSSNLTYLAEELQKRHALRRKIIGALVYPAFITVATIGVTVLLTVFIFPKVMPIFTSLNVTLPFTTKVLLFLSNFLRGYGLYLLGAIIAATVVTVIALRKSPTLHYFVARSVLRLPLFGNLVLQYNMTNFCRTMSLLLRSGFNVVEASTVTSESTPNPVYKRECVALREHIIKGERISAHLEEKPKLFPDMVAHMVMIGETSGSLSDTLMYLAEHYEAEVDDRVKNLSNSIEPVLMVFMGLVVGFVAVSVITPIYEVTQHLNPR